MNQIEQMILSTESLQAVAEQVLSEAKKRGATQAEVSIAANKGFEVNAREGDVETVEYNQDKSVDIIVYFGKRSGSASLSDLRPEALTAAVEAACHIAKFTGEDSYAGLPDASELAFKYPHIDVFSPWHLSVEDAIKMAVECEHLAVNQDKRIMSAESVTVATMQATTLLANSLGFMGVFPFTRHDISCVLVGKQKDEMQREYAYTTASDHKMLAPLEKVATEAVQRTVSRLGARRLPTMKAPVIFAAEEARGLFGHFLAAISGGNIYRKSSFLLDHVGKAVFPSFIHLIEQPHLAHALGSSPFDDDGVLTRANEFIKDGVLQHYAMGVYSARKLGLKTTGNAGGFHNLTVKHGDKNLAELIKTMHRGLVVTELMGQGVNLITGDYSRGVGGYWVENGEIQYPVHEITIAGNLKEMYQRIQAVGNDVDVRGNVRTGSVLIEEMMLAGE